MSYATRGNTYPAGPLGRVLAAHELLAGTTPVFVAPAHAGEVQITSAVLCNDSGAAVVVDVQVIPSPSRPEAGDGAYVVSGASVAAGGTLQLDGIAPSYLGAGDSIVVSADAGGAINVVITGRVLGD